MNVASVVVTAIVIVLTGSVLLVGLAVGARRLLGLQLGLVRTVLAGVVGSAAWLAFGLAIARPAAPLHAHHRAAGDRAAGRDGVPGPGRGGPAERVAPAGDMGASVTAPAGPGATISPDQPDRGPPRPAPLPARPPTPPGRHPGRARRAGPIGAAGAGGGRVSFVKLGQLLATRRDLLPTEFVNELSRLHHQVTPAPWPQVEQVLGQSSARQTRCSTSSTPAPWPPPPSPRCTRPGCAPRGRRWWSRSSAPASGRWSSATWTSWTAWRAGCRPAPDGGPPSAPWSWPAASPTLSTRSSTSGWKRATWPSSRRPRPCREPTPRCGCPPCTRSCAPSGCW